jgi:tetratricopeptide (TPR) repeat protein
MFAGATLAGAAVVTLALPVAAGAGAGVAAAGLAGSLVGGISANFLHQCSDDLAKVLANSPGYSNDYLRNEDIRRLVGETIAAKLKATATEITRDAAVRDRLQVLALKSTEGWLAVAEAESLQSLNEDVVARLFAMSASSYARATALDATTWADFLEYLDGAITDASIGNKIKRIITPGGRAFGTRQLTCAERLDIGKVLEKEFPHALAITAKRAFENNDPAYAALQLRLMRDLMTDVRDILATVSGTADKVDALSLGQTRVEARLLDIAQSVRANAPTVANAVLAANAHDIDDILSEIVASHDQIMTVLRRVAEDTGDIRPRVKDTQDRVGHLERSTREIKTSTAEANKRIGDPTPDCPNVMSALQTVIHQTRPHYAPVTRIPENNFGDVGLPRPISGFKGRTEELDAIDRLLKTTTASSAVVIWAGPGAGKTALAVKFATDWAFEYDHKWYLDASLHAEERSLVGVLRLLGETVEDVHSDADESRIDKLAARFRMRLQRLVAEGSDQGSLVVLDNVQSAETRRRYPLEEPNRVLVTSQYRSSRENSPNQLELLPVPEDIGREILCSVSEQLDPAADEGILNQIGQQCRWNPGCLRILSCALANSDGNDAVRVLESLRRHDVGDARNPLTKGQEDQMPDDYTAGVEASFRTFVEGLKDRRSVRVLEAAAVGAPTDVPLWWLYGVSGMSREDFEAGLLDLRGKRVLEFTGPRGDFERERAGVDPNLQSWIRGRWTGSESAEGVARLSQAMNDAASVFQGRPSNANRPRRNSSWMHVCAAAEWIFSRKTDDSLQRLAAMRLHQAITHLQQTERAALAIDRLSTLIAWAESDNLPDERRGVVLRVSRARSRRALGDLEGSASDLRSAIEVFEKLPTRDAAELAVQYNELSKTYKAQGKWPDALAAINESIRLVQTSHFADGPVLADRLGTRADIHQGMGSTAAAMDDIDACIKWHSEQSSRADDAIFAYRDARADILRLQLRLTEAMDESSESLKWYSQHAVEGADGLQFARITHARILREMGKIKEAYDCLLPVYEWSLRLDHAKARLRAMIRACWASIIIDLEMKEEAAKAIADSIEWYRKNQPYNGPKLAKLLHRQAYILSKIGDWEAASRAITDAIAEYAQSVSDTHEWALKAERDFEAIQAKRMPLRWLDAPAAVVDAPEVIVTVESATAPAAKPQS